MTGAWSARAALLAFNDCYGLPRAAVRSAYCALPASTRSSIAMAWSPDATLLASTHGDHTVKIISVEQGRCVRTLHGHARTPWTVKFHPKSNDIVASGGLDSEVRIWRISTGSCIVSHCISNHAIASVSFHSSGLMLAIAQAQHVYFWGHPALGCDPEGTAGDDDDQQRAPPPNSTDVDVLKTIFSSQPKRFASLADPVRCASFRQTALGECLFIAEANREPQEYDLPVEGLPTAVGPATAFRQWVPSSESSQEISSRAAGSGGGGSMAPAASASTVSTPMRALNALNLATSSPTPFVLGQSGSRWLPEWLRFQSAGTAPSALPAGPTAESVGDPQLRPPPPPLLPRRAHTAGEGQRPGCRDAASAPPVRLDHVRVAAGGAADAGRGNRQSSDDELQSRGTSWTIPGDDQGATPFRRAGVLTQAEREIVDRQLHNAEAHMNRQDARAAQVQHTVRLRVLVVNPVESASRRWPGPRIARPENELRSHALVRPFFRTARAVVSQRNPALCIPNTIIYSDIGFDVSTSGDMLVTCEAYAAGPFNAAVVRSLRPETLGVALFSVALANTAILTSVLQLGQVRRGPGAHGGGAARASDSPPPTGARPP